MGQKINPTGFRLPVTHDWTSRWYASGKNFAQTLAQDLKVRDYLGKKLKGASVSRILIERPAKNAKITVYSARPGVVIGKKGEDMKVLKDELQKMIGVPVHINIEEIRRPDLDAQLIADGITQQLEKRVMFRRAMKRAMQNAMRLGAQGIKIMSSGRLNGAEIARTEWYREGRVPLHTLRADIDYGFSEAHTTYGVIGVKVWVYKGEYAGRDAAPESPAETREDRRNRRPSGKPSNRRGRRGPGEGGEARPPRGQRKPTTPEGKVMPARVSDTKPEPKIPAARVSDTKPEGKVQPAKVSDTKPATDKKADQKPAPKADAKTEAKPAPKADGNPKPAAATPADHQKPKSEAKPGDAPKAPAKAPEAAQAPKAEAKPADAPKPAAKPADQQPAKAPATKEGE